MNKKSLIFLLLFIAGMLFLTSACSRDKQTEKSLPTARTVSTSASFTSANVTGREALDVISFGSYEQDNNILNGKEPVTWIVLAEENGKKLLISEKILDCIPYNEKFGDVTWETCTLRKWMNDVFYRDAFSDDEKAKIILTGADNNNNKNTDSPGGNDTNDFVFAVSYNELRKYALDINLRVSFATNYAKSKGIKVSDKSNSFGNSSWWLRSPGYNSCAAWTVSSDGSYIRGCSYNVNSTTIGVRPSIWITI